MHKDKPPGIFDLADRSARHSVGLGLASGVLLSVLVQTGIGIWRADSGLIRARGTVQDAEKAMTSHRTPGTPPPPPPDAVKY